MSYLNVKPKYAEDLQNKRKKTGNNCVSESYRIYEMLCIRSPVVSVEAAEL